MSDLIWPIGSVIIVIAVGIIAAYKEKEIGEGDWWTGFCMVSFLVILFWPILGVFLGVMMATLIPVYGVYRLTKFIKSKIK